MHHEIHITWKRKLNMDSFTICDNGSDDLKSNNSKNTMLLIHFVVF